MDTSKIRKMFERDEGLRLKPYKCTAGKTTIGFGRNLDDVGISEQLAVAMLSEDVQKAIKGCEKIFGSTWHIWSENRRLGWVNLIFNLGYDGLLKFKNTLRAAQCEDWQLVEQNLRQSLWFKQVGSRAERVIDMICREEFGYV